MRIQLFTLAAFAAFTCAAAASATTLTIQNPTTTPIQQKDNNPCVIGNPSCKNPAGFGYTLIPNGGGPSQNYDLNSPTYTVQQVRDLVGNIFSVGIDVNSAGKTPTETLDIFSADITQTPGVDFLFTGPAALKIGGNPGNGFSDVALFGFDLTGIPGTDTITFRAKLDDDRAGREQYFLIAGEGGGGPNVPEPASLALLGSGLFGIGVVRRAFRRRTNG